MTKNFIIAVLVVTVAVQFVQNLKVRANLTQTSGVLEARDTFLTYDVFHSAPGKLP